MRLLGFFFFFFRVCYSAHTQKRLHVVLRGGAALYSCLHCK
jgi:hypothetical protein